MYLLEIIDYMKTHHSEVRALTRGRLRCPEGDAFKKAWNAYIQAPTSGHARGVETTFEGLMGILNLNQAPQSVQILFAGPDHREGIYRLTGAYDWELGYVHPKSIDEHIEKREALVAVDEHRRVIGFVLFHVRKRDPGMTLYTIAVIGEGKRDYRKTGIGSFMLAFLKAEFYNRCQPGQSIRTKVMTKNDPALQFFGKHGFHIVETQKGNISPVALLEWIAPDPHGQPCSSCGRPMLEDSSEGLPEGWTYWRCQVCHIGEPFPP